MLLGGAVGDALGLPREMLSARRARRVFGGPPLRHALLLRRGLCSDDTEHACMTAQALLASGGDPQGFVRSLAWRLRGWLLGVPMGIRPATAKAIVRLWLGFPPTRSGVYSAGNGPAMRAGVLGVYAADRPDRLRELVHVSTRLTHTDPRAEHGALAVAMAAGLSSRGGLVRSREYLAEAEPRLHTSSLWPLLQLAGEHAEAGSEAGEFFDHIGCGKRISGYINHTVPAAIFCWLRWPGDYRMAVEQIILGGGDTDTTAAIVGGLVGAGHGPESIPPEWLGGLMEWPRSVAWMQRLAGALATALDEAGPVKAGRSVKLFWPGLIPRNGLFGLTVLLHALRRLLPPY